MRNFFYNLRRCWAICRVYWGSCDSDWSSLADLMIFQMRVLAKNIREANVIEDAEQIALEIEATVDALDYMNESRAFDEARAQVGFGGPAWAERVTQLEEDAERRFVEGIAKIRNWWD